MADCTDSDSTTTSLPEFRHIDITQDLEPKDLTMRQAIQPTVPLEFSNTLPAPEKDSPCISKVSIGQRNRSITIAGLSSSDHASRMIGYPELVQPGPENTAFFREDTAIDTVNAPFSSEEMEYHGKGTPSSLDMLREATKPSYPGDQRCAKSKQLFSENRLSASRHGNQLLESSHKQGNPGPISVVIERLLSSTPNAESMSNKSLETLPMQLQTPPSKALSNPNSESDASQYAPENFSTDSFGVSVSQSDQASERRRHPLNEAGRSRNLSLGKAFQSATETVTSNIPHSENPLPSEMNESITVACTGTGIGLESKLFPVEAVSTTTDASSRDSMRMKMEAQKLSSSIKNGLKRSTPVANVADLMIASSASTSRSTYVNSTHTIC